MRLTALMKRNRRTGGGGIVSSTSSVPPPTGGWDSISQLANMPPDRAYLLDNFFPQPGYVEPRRGFLEDFDTGETTPVESLMAYHGQTPTDDRLFAAANGSLYERTGTIPAETGFANSRFQHVNFTTTGGHFLYVVNGADTPAYFDGSAWANPTITGITASDIIGINIHRNRLWFVLAGTSQAAYLDVDSIQGAATTFELGGLFSLGGYLMAMGTWSIDGGDGPEDYAVFVSSRGQVAVYAGDPDTTFELKGVYLIGPPIGRRCFTRVGADLVIISIDGVLPVSSALVLERGASIRAALTANIQPTMNQAARDWGDNFGWQLISYPRGTRAILNVPALENSQQQQYVMNTVTGAWCRFTGMQANCWETFQDRLFFGGNAGLVYEADVGGSDDGEPIQVDMRTAYNYFGMRGNLKRWTMIRPILTTDGTVSPGIALNVDFRDDVVVSTASSSLVAGALWDVALWDVDLWPASNLTQADWQSVTGIGYCASIRMTLSILATGGADIAPTLRVNAFDLVMEPGAFV